MYVNVSGSTSTSKLFTLSYDPSAHSIFDPCFTFFDLNPPPSHLTFAFVLKARRFSPFALDPVWKMATMESLIGLVNRIQRACTVLGDHGGEGMSLWEALPSVAVVGGQVSSFSLHLSHFFRLNFWSECFSQWEWYFSDLLVVSGIPISWLIC